MIDTEQGMVELPDRVSAAYKAMEELRVAARVIDNAAAKRGGAARYIVRPPEGKELTAVEQRIGGAHPEVWGRKTVTADEGFVATGARLSMDGLRIWGSGHSSSGTDETRGEVTFTRFRPITGVPSSNAGYNRYASQWELTVPAEDIEEFTIEPIE